MTQIDNGSIQQFWKPTSTRYSPDIGTTGAQSANRDETAECKIAIWLDELDCAALPPTQQVEWAPLPGVDMIC